MIRLPQSTITWGEISRASLACASHTHSLVHLWVFLSKPCITGWTWKLGNPSLTPEQVCPQVSCNKPWYVELMVTTATIFEAPTQSQPQWSCSRTEGPRLPSGTQLGLLNNIVENIQYLHCAKLMTNTPQDFTASHFVCFQQAKLVPVTFPLQRL